MKAVPVMDAFIATARPELFVATTGGVNVKGRQFKDIVQNMADMFMWGQYQDPTVGGGWRYGWQNGPDNSTSTMGCYRHVGRPKVLGLPGAQLGQTTESYLGQLFNG